MNFYQRVGCNTLGTDYFCGDLHGMYPALLSALAEVGFQARYDRLFCTGDLIDRGPASRECLLLLEEPWFFSVLGNHEEMFIDYLLHGNRNAEWMWRVNSGGWGDGEQAVALAELARLAQQKMPYLLEIESPGGTCIGICHAEYPLDDWRDRDRLATQANGLSSLTWSRRRLFAGNDQPVTHIDALLHGHSIVEQPKRLGNCWFIDTGAFLTERVRLYPASYFLADTPSLLGLRWAR